MFYLFFYQFFCGLASDTSEISIMRAKKRQRRNYDKLSYSSAIFIAGSVSNATLLLFLPLYALRFPT